MVEDCQADNGVLDRVDELSTRPGLLVQRLKVIRPSTSYLAATLLSDGRRWGFSFQSNFAGFPDGQGPDHGIELRKPSLVYPEKMISYWDNVGQSWIVVNDEAQLAVYLRLGGNALLVEDLTHRRLAEFIKPRAYANVGPMGFRRYDPQAREAQQRRPRPKQRKRILERDGHICQKCGRSPTKDSAQSQFQLHHIKPFSKGGLTVDDNLVTLCRDCHESLDPHDQLWLFWYSDGPMCRASDRLSTEAHDKGVEAYRQLVARAMTKLDRREQASWPIFRYSFEHVQTNESASNTRRQPHANRQLVSGHSAWSG